MLYPPKSLGGILPNLVYHFPLMVRVCKSRIIFLCICPSVHPSSVHLSVILSPPTPLGGIHPNFLHNFPSWWRCARATFFTCIHRPSICPSPYLLLNHWVEFNQTCYITSPHSKGLQEQHYFSVRPSSIYLPVMLSPPKPLGGIQPNLLHHFPSW